MRRALLLLAMTVIATSASPAAQAQAGYGLVHASDQAAPQPLLTWPGKSGAPSAPQPSATLASRTLSEDHAPLPQPAVLRQSTPPQATPTSLYQAPPQRWRSADVAPPAPAPPAAAPQSAPQAATPGLGEGQPPHFYSVARQYGVQPDPVQLSPQFLATTPQSDMAEPPPLPPPHTAGPQSANMSTAAATNQVRQAQEAAADADTAALGN